MPEIQNLITDNLDIWTSAIKNKKAVGRGSRKKLELTGIKKLRELILELAVRGKLVPQDPDDEPASVLLEKIAAEKELLIKDKRIKKQKLLPKIMDKDNPFYLPTGWKWVRLQDIIYITSGDGLTAAKMNSDGQIPVFGGNGINGYHDKGNVLKATIVIGRVGFYCGSIHITPENAWITDNAFKTVFSEGNINLFYLSWLLKGTNLKENESATAQPVISGRKIYPIVVGLPPLNEQYRIADKIDELMALCDQLEQQSEESITAHQTLVDTLLNALVSPEQDASTFTQQPQRGAGFTDSWTLIEQNFDALFTTEQSIDKLKQTILQLAIMGKLVPQDPNDEPASVLLEKITVKKEKLYQEKKIKKQPKLPDLTDNEKPFKLPLGWEFTRFGNISNRMGSGSTPRGGKNAYTQEGISFLRSQNILNGELKLSDVAFIPLETHEKMSNTKVIPYDILLNITGGSLGRSSIYPDDIGEANVSQHVSIIRLTNLETRFFVHNCILSPYIQNMIWGRQVGMAREGLSKKVLELFEIPIPPLAEQHRIVKKVDSLMALCDKLKSQLINKKNTQQNLATAFVKKTLASTSL